MPPLRSVLAPLVRVGGSAAQREIVEETLLHALMAAGRLDEARAMIDARLDRRPGLPIHSGEESRPHDRGSPPEDGRPGGTVGSGACSRRRGGVA